MQEKEELNTIFANLLEDVRDYSQEDKKIILELIFLLFNDKKVIIKCDKGEHNVQTFRS